MPLFFQQDLSRKCGLGEAQKGLQRFRAGEGGRMKGLEVMHRLFGRSREYLCRECIHFRRKKQGSRLEGMCTAYSSCREENGWKGESIGCGLAPDRPFSGPLAAERNRQNKNRDTVPEGQMRLF